MIPVCATLLMFTPPQLDTMLDAARPPGQPPARVGRIIVEGNTITHLRVIQNQLGFYPGQVLRFAQLEQARRNLVRLGLFDEADPVTVTIMPDADITSYYDVRVRVKETRTGMVSCCSSVNSNGPK